LIDDLLESFVIKELDLCHHTWDVKEIKPFYQTNHFDYVKQLLAISFHFDSEKWNQRDEIHCESIIQVVHCSFADFSNWRFFCTRLKLSKELKQHMNKENAFKNCSSYPFSSSKLATVSFNISTA